MDDSREPCPFVFPVTQLSTAQYQMDSLASESNGLQNDVKTNPFRVQLA